MIKEKIAFIRHCEICSVNMYCQAAIFVGVCPETNSHVREGQGPQPRKVGYSGTELSVHLSFPGKELSVPLTFR